VSHSAFKNLLLVSCFFWLASSVSGQKVIQETFYHNSKGLTYIPPLSRPSLIYQGKLFTGRKQLSALFSHLNNAELNKYFSKYKSNKTASGIIKVAGIGLSLYSLIDWRGTDDGKFNWYVFGGGVVLSGLSGYLDGKAHEHLRNAAVVFDHATQRTTFRPAQRSLGVVISLSK
jgi:hypothetical protein